MRVARWLLATLLLLGGCRGHVRSAAQSPELPLSELSVDFPQREEGRLVFALEVPRAAHRAIKQLTWELWLGSVRFATGIEGVLQGVAQPDERLRVRVDAPLVYRHLTWVEGSAYLEVVLKAEVELSGAAAERWRFFGQRRLLVHGKPVHQDFE